MAVARVGLGDKAFFYLLSSLLAFLLLSGKAFVLYLLASAGATLWVLRWEKQHWRRVGLASPEHKANMFFGHMDQMFSQGLHQFDMENTRTLGETHG